MVPLLELLLDMPGFGKDEEDEECLMVAGFDGGLAGGPASGLDSVTLEMMVLIWVPKFGGAATFCITVTPFIPCLVITWSPC